MLDYLWKNLIEVTVFLMLLSVQKLFKLDSLIHIKHFGCKLLKNMIDFIFMTHFIWLMSSQNWTSESFFIYSKFLDIC